MDCQEQHFVDQIQIDQEWISPSGKEKSMIDHSLLMCMICYGIPLGEYSQCVQCGKIFCERDYQEVKNTLDSCPNCKNAPFAKKAKPHILYTSIFDRITFQCQLCKQKTQKRKQNKNGQHSDDQAQKKENGEKQNQPQKFTKDELSTHINDCHKAKIMDFSFLYDFQVLFDKGEKFVFDLYQNMELNQKFFEYQNKKKESKKKCPYQMDNGHILVIDLQTELVTSPTLQKTGKLTKKMSKQLKKGIEYQVWQILLDYDFKYYSQNIQELVIKNHQQFLQNKRMNEFTFDMKDQRYRISFTKMKQINTYTDYERPIRKTVVKFQ